MVSMSLVLSIHSLYCVFTDLCMMDCWCKIIFLYFSVRGTFISEVPRFSVNLHFRGLKTLGDFSC